jgi:Fur family ferric uptake transcriptional regulator
VANAERRNRGQLEVEAKETLRRYLKTKGLRATRQREVVLEAFVGEDSHISVEELYERIRQRDPRVGHATVYRSMNLFVDAGIAKERRFHEGRVRYERGVNVGHHDHLVCLQCGDIQEFEDPTIEKIQSEIAGTRGFQVRYHRLELYGFCSRCQADAEEARTK